jgi:hypothetical protein
MTPVEILTALSELLTNTPPSPFRAPVFTYSNGTFSIKPEQKLTTAEVKIIALTQEDLRHGLTPQKWEHLSEKVSLLIDKGILK